MDNSNKLLGGILICLGIIWGINSFFNIGAFWPLIILAIGIILESIYFKTGKNIGLLVPGGILIVIGILFVFETITRWHFAVYTWPIYILAVAFGIYQLYLFGVREKALLVPVAILTIIALTSYYFMFFHRWVRLGLKLIIPIGLIIIGLLIITNSNLFRKEK